MTGSTFGSGGGGRPSKPPWGRNMTAVQKKRIGIFAATSAVLFYLVMHAVNPFPSSRNPDVCHSCPMSALRVNSNSHQDSGPCQYGSLPGVLNLNSSKPAGSRWQTAVPNCQLQNLLMPSPKTGHVKVLLLGDSSECYTIKEWCTELRQPVRVTPPANMTGSVASFAAAAKAAAAGSNGTSNGPLKQRHVMYYCKPESGSAAAAAAAAGAGDGIGSISLGMYHTLGVHLDGPFFDGHKGNFLTRVRLAVKAFEAVLGGAPDLVLLHSNFWDQARLRDQRQPGYGNLSKLLPDVVSSWSSNFSLLLSTTAALLPESVLMATRTAPLPAIAANWPWPYVHQLNVASIEVSRLHGVPAIDMAGMVFGLEPHQYLRDNVHPIKIVLLESVNIAMNLLRQHQQQSLGQT